MKTVAQRSGSAHTLIEGTRHRKDREMSLVEAITCAKSGEPPIVVEHNGEGGAGGHFVCYCPDEAPPMPRQLKDILSKHRLLGKRGRK